MVAHITAIGVIELEYSGVLIEIRAGSGGEDAEVFAAELLQMYRNFSHDQGWSTEIVLRQDSGDHRLKQAMLKVVGEGTYLKLNNETGRHRVQRVPASERRGRIHTSVASVVVMPLPGESLQLEKIRTYNFPEDEARDHRRKVKVGGVRDILGGKLDLILDHMQGDS